MLFVIPMLHGFPKIHLEIITRFRTLRISKKIDLKRETTLGDAIDFLRAVTHPPYKNAYFLDDEGNKVFVSISLDFDRE